jgi:hypothetical protein
MKRLGQAIVQATLYMETRKCQEYFVSTKIEDPYQARGIKLIQKKREGGLNTREEGQEIKHTRRYGISGLFREASIALLDLWEDCIFADPPEEIQGTRDSATCLECTVNHFPKCLGPHRYGPARGGQKQLRYLSNMKAIFIGTGMMTYLPSHLNREFANLSLDVYESGSLDTAELAGGPHLFLSIMGARKIPLYKAILKRIKMAKRLLVIHGVALPIFVEYYIPSVVTGSQIRRIAIFIQIMKLLQMTALNANMKITLIAVIPPPRPQVGREFKDMKNDHVKICKAMMAMGDAMGVPVAPLFCTYVHSERKGGYLGPPEHRGEAIYGPEGQPSAEMGRRMAMNLRYYLNVWNYMDI